mmetsp:Transcript_13354/g.36838  ORF Transcript_13354/g.36838 Transcript_13354/m.36838 type:complete len:84 (+) Transcript_13354:2090-2341(+)
MIVVCGGCPRTTNELAALQSIKQSFNQSWHEQSVVPTSLVTQFNGRADRSNRSEQSVGAIGRSNRGAADRLTGVKRRDAESLD